MKKLLYLIPLFLGLALTSCYKDDIRDLQNQINKIKGTQIASLQKQIDAIKTTLPKLEQTDKELNDYIAALQTTATNLQSSINETNAKIEEVKSSLHSDISATKTEILAELSAMQNEMDGELKKINNTIQTLQAMDGALDTKIEDLKRYVDTELANTQDWANATFATLEQYSEVASDIATIKQSIITLNKNLEAFEQRVSETIVTEITKALEPIKDELIAEVISEIADTYMSAISNATEEVTEAYNRAISTAIATLEESMMSWVSDQLKGYYTIAEVEGKLAAIENTISNNDMALAAEIDALYKSLAESKAETTAEYEKAIADAIKTNDGVIDGKIAVAIAEVNIRIENEIKAINTKIEDIESRLEKVEGDIATIGEQIDNINNTIITLQDADAQLSVYIDELQTTATNLQNAIDETNVLIDNLTNEMGNEILNAKADVLEQLARLRDEMMCELEQIHKTILTLQDKDEELDQKIALLQEYVIVELANNKDWANATFATLEQYAAISSELSVIQAEITYITQNITSLEKRINDKIEYEITVAISALDSSIQDRVQAITTAYSAAISAAREEITAAYTAEIQNAFAALEYKMKNWVNEQLQEYYTIYEVDGMLAVLRNEVTNSDNAILAEIEALEEALAKSKDELINVYSEIVKRAINENNGVIDDMIAGAIAQATARIDNDIKTIISNIASIESRLNKVEGDIANINGQIANINNTIQSLQNAHDELEAYVGYLQSVASNLQESIGSINGRIDEVETAMQDELSTAKAEIIAQLSSLKRDVEDELSQINEAIVILQAKDAQLDNKITTLQSYVDTELANNKDWANATFATLEQQNALAGEVATIKAQISTINQSISDLENRISAKISRDIADAAATLNTTIQDKISEVTSAYTAAISKAKSDITAAYTAEIQNAFSALEYTMKRWVNEQLAGYYTIAEVDALLAAMQNEFNGQLASQRAYLEGLISTLSNELTGQIAANSSLISSLRNSIDEIQNTTSASYATKIAENAAAIAKNAQSIIDNAAAIASNKSDIETNAALIAQNKSATEANSALIAQNKSAIEGMQITTNAAITKCAADITTNAENIAKNAALIAQNATAINNNSQAIANNAADILQLQRDLAKAKDDITAAYTVAISTAINTLNGELRGEIASQIATINSRINTEVATINSAIETLSNRVTALEGEVDAIQQQIADILTDIAEIKQDIENLMKRIQSVTYIPKYSDGKAYVTDGVVELDFQISPKDAVNAIAANWQSVLSVKAVYTITRAVSFIDMPILSCEVDSANGIITIVASADNMSEAFFIGNQSASISLTISDGNNCVTSTYIPTMPYHPLNEIWYTTSNHAIIEPVTECDFGANIISNTYHDGKGIIKFDGDVTHIICEKTTSYGNPYYDSVFDSRDKYRLTSIKFPDSVTMIASDAFYGHLNLAKIDIGGGLISLGNSFSMGSVSDTMVTVYCRAQTPPIIERPNSSTFSNLSVIYVPKGSVDVYKTADGWKNYADKIVPYDFEKGEVVPGNNQILAKIDIPDLALKNYLVDTYDDNGNNEIDIVEADKITMVDCSGKSVADLTGLESCTNLVTLNCSNNNITKMELPNLAQLETVTCNNCPIEIMNFNGCTSLQYLNLQDATTNAIIGNKLKITNYNQAASLSIDVSNTTLEQIFVCRSEILTHLDVSKNTHLKALEAYVNPNLKSIDVSSLINLEFLDLGDCDLTNLDVSKNLMLTELYVTNNKLSTIDVSQNKQLKVLKCKGNQLSNLNILNNDKLETLIVEDNKLSAINVHNNTELTYLNINNNVDISTVSIKYNTELTELYASGLSITDIDLSSNTKLRIVSLLNEHLTAITASSLPNLKGIVYIEKTDDQKGMVISTNQGYEKWSGAKTWCSNYGSGWYLPSCNEWEVIYNNKDKINFLLSELGFTTLETCIYWSSNEAYSNLKAYGFNFSKGDMWSDSKDNYFDVHAVLAF